MRQYKWNAGWQLEFCSEDEKKPEQNNLPVPKWRVGQTVEVKNFNGSRSVGTIASIKLFSWQERFGWHAAEAYIIYDVPWTDHHHDIQETDIIGSWHKQETIEWMPPRE